ncbi:MAG: nicotinate phosphoribosyltransferase [Gammaproteobacteria bacterium]|nr:nicotinate phosphoribosyltransferase [Gammaproteobacteria bacterium]
MQKAIITSLLDTDLYKLTMMQCVLHHFPAAMVEYKFQCRTPNIDLSLYIEEIRVEIESLCQLNFQSHELEFLGKLDYIKSDFIEFLRVFKLNSNFIHLKTETDNQENNQLELVITGPWLHTILFEVPVLAIINEVYFRNKLLENNLTLEQAYLNGQELLDKKIGFLKNLKNNNIGGFKFSDFGTRRRFSKHWQERVVKYLKDNLPNNFIGTSNIQLAYQYDLLPVGTMAHEFLQACQALGPRLVDSQKFALETWTKEFRGRLGIALTDIISMDAFLNDFDLFFAKLFDGLRHDSGDPIVWGDKAIAHYKKLKINPMSKRLIFSDNLTIESAINIYNYFFGRAKTAYGIGTSLTNDVGFTPIQIVIKMIKCNNQPVAKISDSPGKTICTDSSYVKYLRQVFSTK